MDRLLNVTALVSLALIVLVLVSLRRAHIRVEYSVSWLGVGLALLLLSRSDWLLNRMAEFLGVSYPPAVLMLIVMALFLMVFFGFSVILSDLKEANIALAQRVAILEFQVHSLQVQSLNEERQTKVPD